MNTVNNKKPLEDAVMLAVLYAIIKLTTAGQKTNGIAIQHSVITALNREVDLVELYEAIIDLLHDDRITWKIDDQSEYARRRVYAIKIPDDMVLYGPNHPQYPQAPEDWNKGPVMHVDGLILPTHGISNELAWFYDGHDDGTDILAYPKIEDSL
jgi:hypothetical protein